MWYFDDIGPENEIKLLALQALATDEEKIKINKDVGIRDDESVVDIDEVFKKYDYILERRNDPKWIRKVMEEYEQHKRQANNDADK